MIFKVVFLLLLAPILGACAAVTPLDPLTAQTRLTTVWQADQHIVWEIEWPAAPVGGPVVVETWRAGPVYRYEILEATAPELVGQTLIFDGRTAWRYNRFDSAQPPARPIQAQLSPVTDAFALVGRLIATVPEHATQEASQFARQPAQRFSLTFNKGDSLTFWQDEATELPVQIQFVIAGQSVTLRARHFEPLSDLPPELFEVVQRK